MNRKQAVHSLPEATTRFPCPHCLEKEEDGWMIKSKDKSKFKCNNSECKSEMSLQTAYGYIEKCNSQES